MTAAYSPDSRKLRHLGRRLLRTTSLTHGWQRRVAEHLSVPDSTISDILAGRRGMSAAVRDKVTLAIRRL